MAEETNDEHRRIFSKGPVVGFLVDDVETARMTLEAGGIEFIGPVHEWEPTGEAWSHFVLRRQRLRDNPRTETPITRSPGKRPKQEEPKHDARVPPSAAVRSLALRVLPCFEPAVRRLTEKQAPVTRKRYVPDNGVVGKVSFSSDQPTKVSRRSASRAGSMACGGPGRG
jgi:hypothetical protein